MCFGVACSKKFFSRSAIAFWFNRGSLLWRLNECDIPPKGFWNNRGREMAKEWDDCDQKDSVEDKGESPSFHPASLNDSERHV